MKKLCGADTPVRLSALAIKLRERRGCLSVHGLRRPFPCKSARAAQMLLIAIIFLPAMAHAYAGPGAGFAVLSSFWAIFVAFLYSFYALMTGRSGNCSVFCEEEMPMAKRRLSER